MTDISDGIQFRRDGVDPKQWPKLSCSQANQLALEVSDLRLDANREILFQGNGQLTASGDMLFLTGGSSPEKLTVLANGNVGIGITAPTEKLEVAGKIKASQLDVSGTVKAVAFQGDGSALTGKVSTAGDTINGSLTIQNALTVSGNVGIGITAPTEKLEVAGKIKASQLDVSGTVKAATFQGDGSALTGKVSTAGDTINGSLTIQNSLTVSGNVRIGTTSSGAKLDIDGRTFCRDALDFGDTASDGYGTVGMISWGQNQKFLVFGRAGWGLGLGANGRTTDIYIQPSGNVGIGTTSPAARLEISDSFRGSLKLLATSGVGHDFGYDGGGDSLFWFTHYGAESGETKFRWDNGTSARDLLVIKNTGNVGIGTTAPAYKLDVAGAAHASSFPTSSDVRLKKDITQLTNVLQKLEKIRGVAFEWNELYESLGRSTGHKEIGVTAQEVEAVFPELVTTWGDEGYKAVDYGRLTGVLIEAAKELKAENEALKQRIEALETAIEKT